MISGLDLTLNLSLNMKEHSKEIIEMVLVLSTLVIEINILVDLKMDKSMDLVLIQIRMDNLFKENGIWASFKNEIKYFLFIIIIKCFWEKLE